MNKVYCVKETWIDFGCAHIEKYYFNDKGAALSMAALLKSKFLKRYIEDNLGVEDYGECGFTIFDRNFDIDEYNYSVGIEEAMEV